MKLSGFAIVLSLFLLEILKAQHLTDNKNKLTDDVYIKAGYGYSYRTGAGYVLKDRNKRNTARSVFPEGSIDGFGGGIGYEYNNRLYFELIYEYMGDLGYSNSETFEQYYGSVNNSYESHDFTMRGIYFVNNDRRDDPIYFISGLSFSVQRVKNTFVDEYEDRKETVFQSYNRYVLGPVAGLEIYWDIWPISFQTELSFGARVEIFRGTRFSETLFNFNFSPLIRFR
ncbi:MAG: hypothetical protein L0Y79_12515 [Chlorobi bacterium]|nr:hypothetical protein [Chlorobiota bacterium]MCI0716829.1 hypothetical protein [Chlorobiota bacterium]